LRRLLVLLATSMQAAFSFMLRRAVGKLTTAQRAAWLHEWCGVTLRRLGIKIESDGEFPARGLLVSNHLSYLDILVFSALSPCVFVSKKEVRSWPLYGWLARVAGTVFVDRSRSADSYRANLGMGRALSEGNIVVLFPEGTSSDGTSLLPFHAALFEAAITSREPVTAARISYAAEDGSVENDICYWGTMSFGPHVLRFLSLRGVRARVRFAAEARMFEERRTAANATRDAVLALADATAAHIGQPPG